MAIRIYLDICAIQRPLDDLSNLRVRLEADIVAGVIERVERGEAVLVASAAHEIETQRNPYPRRRAHAEAVLALARVHADITEAVAARAASYETGGLRRLDALHLACAVEAASDLFCTTDDRLLRRAAALNTGATRVVAPFALVDLLSAP